MWKQFKYTSTGGMHKVVLKDTMEYYPVKSKNTDTCYNMDEL